MLLESKYYSRINQMNMLYHAPPEATNIYIGLLVVCRYPVYGSIVWNVTRKKNLVGPYLLKLFKEWTLNISWSFTLKTPTNHA